MLAGERPPSMSSEKQHLFYITHCKAGQQPFRVLNSNSVKNEFSLVCGITAESKVKRRVRACSAAPHRLITHVNQWGVAGNGGASER